MGLSHLRHCRRACCWPIGHGSKQYRATEIQCAAQETRIGHQRAPQTPSMETLRNREYNNRVVRVPEETGRNRNSRCARRGASRSCARHCRGSSGTPRKAANRSNWSLKRKQRKSEVEECHQFEKQEDYKLLLSVFRLFFATVWRS